MVLARIHCAHQEGQLRQGKAALQHSILGVGVLQQAEVVHELIKLEDLLLQIIIFEGLTSNRSPQQLEPFLSNSLGIPLSSGSASWL